MTTVDASNRTPIVAIVEPNKRENNGTEEESHNVYRASSSMMAALTQLLMKATQNIRLSQVFEPMPA